MGASQSAPSKFHAQTTKLNELVSKVVSKDDKFRDPNYNFLFSDTCSKHTLLWEKELNSHLKVDLESISGAIYIIPKKDHVENLTKADLCEKIIKHYLKILYIFSLIKNVYDLENSGERSIAGIMQRNVRILDGSIMEISFCSIPQRDYDLVNPTKLDFSNLEGLHVFVQHFLTPVERHAFCEQLKAIFARLPRHRLVDAICADTLSPLADAQKLYASKLRDQRLVCKTKPAKKRGVDLLFDVAAYNPIFNTNYCNSRKKIVVPLTPKLRELHDAMSDRYKANVDAVVKNLESLLEPRVGHDGVRALRNISSEHLKDIIRDVKKSVSAFYLQSIVDFQALLDEAKVSQHSSLDAV